jgi:dihydrofolate reductase
MAGKAKFKLFIATSLDGFIAREDGSVDWLDNLPNPRKIDHGYSAFYASVDRVLMGRKTYEEVLGFGLGWPYADRETHIITSRESYPLKTPKTSLLTTLDHRALEALRTGSQKDIWVVGGGGLIRSMLQMGAIDVMTLCIIPILLGKGIRLFRKPVPETQYEFEGAEPFETGIVNLTYRKK